MPAGDVMSIDRVIHELVERPKVLLVAEHFTMEVVVTSATTERGAVVHIEAFSIGDAKEC